MIHQIIQLKDKISQLKNEIDLLQKEIDTIQLSCEHKLDGNSTYVLVSSNCYECYYKCIICDKITIKKI